MRKRFISLSVSLLLLAMLALPAQAASANLSDSEALLPVDIIIDQNSREIRKVYDLSPNTDPAMLPMEAFERDGSRYECTDILREVVIGSETQTITQTETVDSAKKDMEIILELLPQDKETTTEDGFSGTLHLVLDSIKTEPSGYGSSTKPVTATRSYPNLASADTHHLPKTITEGGQTLKLQDVQWQTDNTYNADDYEIGDRFTAICTYGGSKSVSYVTGYTTTANYTGEVYRTGVTVIRYTVIYTGTPIAPADPEPVTEEEPPQTGAGWPVMTALGLAALAAGVGGTYFVMKRKERMSYEETADNRRGGADAHHDDGHDGHGGRV